MSLNKNDTKKFDDNNLLDLFKSLAEKISTIFIACTGIAIVIGFLCLISFCQIENIRISFVSLTSFSLFVEIGGMTFVLLAILCLFFIKPIFMVDIVSPEVLMCFSSENLRLRRKSILVFMVIQAVISSVIMMLGWLAIEKLINYYVILPIIFISVLLSLVFIKFMFDKHIVKNSIFNCFKILGYNFYVCLVVLIIMNIVVNGFLVSNNFWLFAFVITFFILQNALVVLYSQAIAKRSLLMLLKSLFICFIIMSTIVVSFEPKMMLVNPILNFTIVNWKAPKQFYITEAQTQMIDNNLWSKKENKNITIPLCIIFDDGQTVYTRTLDGVDVELSKKEINTKGSKSSPPFSENMRCDKVI